MNADLLCSGSHNGADRGPAGFSLIAGGPLYRLYIRSHLCLPEIEKVHRLIAIVVLFCWFPLLLISLAEGRFYDTVRIPFVSDIEVHTRLLVAIPLLLAGEYIVHRLLRPLVLQFVDRGIVPPADRARFEDLIESAIRLRNSKTIEALLFFAAVCFGVWLWDRNPVPGQPTWYSDSAGHLTIAGYWYGFVSLNVLRFLMLRWYFRLSVWYGFLSGVRALPLHLNLFHPDRAGGLGFLASTVPAFAPVLVAQSVLAAGMFGNRILHGGSSLQAFKMEILGIAIFLMLTVLAPLFPFAIPLAVARQRAIQELGTLASRYVEEFRSKWIRRTDPPPEPLLGTPDVQSLADISGAYETVSGMASLPFTTRMLAQLAILVLLPFAPLTLTLIPLDKMIDGMIKLIL